ncbi:MAG: hypothetical protein AB8U25_05375 [Rickettsiales endosymbiont of Dermacentor nuttalli]
MAQDTKKRKELNQTFTRETKNKLKIELEQKALKVEDEIYDPNTEAEEINYKTTDKNTHPISHNL